MESCKLRYFNSYEFFGQYEMVNDCAIKRNRRLSFRARLWAHTGEYRDGANGTDKSALEERD